MDGLGENLKKVMLAGVGAVAVTAEKSKELLDEMVKKGELTVEQGKVLNEELKHNIRQTMKEKVNVSLKPNSPEELQEMIGKMTPEQLMKLTSYPQTSLTVFTICCAKSLSIVEIIRTSFFSAVYQ